MKRSALFSKQVCLVISLLISAQALAEDGSPTLDPGKALDTAFSKQQKPAAAAPAESKPFAPSGKKVRVGSDFSHVTFGVGGALSGVSNSEGKAAGGVGLGITGFKSGWLSDARLLSGLGVNTGMTFMMPSASILAEGSALYVTKAGAFDRGGCSPSVGGAILGMASSGIRVDEKAATDKTEAANAAIAIPQLRAGVTCRIPDMANSHMISLTAVGSAAATTGERKGWERVGAGGNLSYQSDGKLISLTVLAPVASAEKKFLDASFYVGTEIRSKYDSRAPKVLIGASGVVSAPVGSSSSGVAQEPILQGTLDVGATLE